MATVTKQETAVALDAAHWDVEGYRIWESTEPGVLLYVRNELRPAIDPMGRPLASVTRILQWNGEDYEPTGGSASFGFLGADPDDAAALLSLQDRWTRVIRGSGYDGAGPGADPRYLPLPIRDATLSAELGPAQATLSPGHTGSTLLVDLTAAGVSAWTAAIGDHAPVAGTIRLSYAYPRLMPPATAIVQVHGRKVYAQLTAALTVAADGELSGTEAEIRTAWAGLVRAGAIEVSLTGATASALAHVRDGLVEQARENLFEAMFVNRMEATSGPSRYALRWKRAEDVPDLPLMVSVEGQTWLTETLEASVAQILGRLDPSTAVHDVYPSVSVPVWVYVDRCELVESVAVSLDFGDLRPPEVVMFDKTGGSQRFTVTTDHLDQFAVRVRARVNFHEPSWPLVTVEKTIDLTDLSVILKPQSWVAGLDVVAYVIKDGQIVQDAWGEDDMLAVNFRYESPDLPTAITLSASIDPFPASLTINYLLPGPSPGSYTIGVLGSFGGRVLRDSRDLGTQESVVLLHVENGSVRILTLDEVLAEPDPVGQRLRAPGGRPLVRREIPPRPEAGRALSVSLDVALVPQPTTVSCWAAAMAMVIGSRDQISLAPADVAEPAGMDVDTSYAWPQIRAALAAWGLIEEGSRSSPPQEWAALLLEWGPIWVVEVGAPYHAVVVGGIDGDGTVDGTWVQLYNPWPPGVGSVEWKTFMEFDHEFGLGAGAGAAMVHG